MVQNTHVTAFEMHYQILVFREMLPTAAAAKCTVRKMFTEMTLKEVGRGELRIRTTEIARKGIG